MKKYIGIIAAYLLIAFAMTWWAQGQLLASEYESSAFYAKAVATDIDNSYSEIDGVGETKQSIEFEIKSGPDKGSLVRVSQVLTGDVQEVQVVKGDKMMLYAAEGESGYTYYVEDYYHLDGLIWIVAIFIVLALILGGKSGLKAIFSLGISLLLIFGVLVPLAKAGMSPVPVAIIVGGITSIFAITIIQGFNISSITAIAGTVGGLVMAGLIAWITVGAAHLSGLGAEESRLLAAFSPELNFQGLFLAGIMIGALGAIMDVAVSISSSLLELKKHKSKITTFELIESGLNVGKDIMGSMMNTLVFAYVGASLTMIMLFYGSGTDLIEILNYGFISEEVSRSLIGSFGLLATIPLTAIVGGLILGKK